MSEENVNGGCAPSDCASCPSKCGSVPQVPNPTIKLTLDDDTELECAVLTTFQVEEQEYIALLPLNENGKNEDGNVFLFRYKEEDGQPLIENIERNDEYMAAASAFDEYIEQFQTSKSEAEAENESK